MDTGKRLLAAAALAAGIGAAHASTPPSLEDAFWACDYIATTRGTAEAPATCVDAYEEFKLAKFDGDFAALVAWWQENKADAHARMADLVAQAPEAPIVDAPAQAALKPSRIARLMAATRAYFEEIAAAMRND